MSLKGKFAMWAIKRELDKHSDEINAEIDRLKAIRSLDDLKVWGREKGGALGALIKQHGPKVLEFIKAEIAKRGGKGTGR